MEEKYYKREGRRFVPVELPQTLTIATNNVGKYYQSDGTFAAERNKDSIGFCILSSPTQHVVMALKDCESWYDYDEAVKEVKNHFDGKGRIPTTDEMLRAFTNFWKELGLKNCVYYRAVRFRDNNIGKRAVVRCAILYNALSATTIHNGFADFRTNLRPVVIIKQSSI